MHRLRLPLALAVLLAFGTPGAEAAGAGDCATFSAPELVLGALDEGAHLVSPPAVTSQGDVWICFVDEERLLHVLTFDAGSGAWGAAQPLSNRPIVGDPRITVDAADVVTAAWKEDAGVWLQIMTARHDPLLGWLPEEPAHQVDEGFVSTLYMRALGTDAAGNVLLGYSESSDLHVVTYRVASENWGEPVEFDATVFQTWPTFVTNEAKTRTCLLYFSTAGSGEGISCHEWNDADLSWGPRVLLPGTESVQQGASINNGHIAAVMDGAGDLTVAWQGWEEDGYHLYTSQSSVGVWQPPLEHAGGYIGGFNGPGTSSAIDITDQGEIIASMLGSHRSSVTPFCCDEFDLFVLRYTPEAGWDEPRVLRHWAEPIDEPDTATVFYSGDRAVTFALLTDRVLAWQFNGTDWSVDEVDVPAALAGRFNAITRVRDKLLVTPWDWASVEISSALFESVQAFSNLGAGLAGALGTPVHAASCQLEAGAPVTFELANAAPDAAGFWVLGLSAASQPLLGGVLVPAPEVALPIATSALGSLSIPVVWPASFPAGLTIYSQFALADAGVPAGFSFSNALSGTTL